MRKIKQNKPKDEKIVCSRCKGKGWEKITNDKGYITSRVPCSKCLGDRRLDWLENIVGKKRNWIRLGVVVDLSYRVPSFDQEDIDKIRESIVKACGIPKKYLIGEKE